LGTRIRQMIGMARTWNLAPYFESAHTC